MPVTTTRPSTRTALGVALATGGLLAAPLAPTAVAARTLAAAPAVTTAAALPAVEAPALARVAGADRYATSVAASRVAFPSGTRAPVVFLVSGTSRSEGYGAIAGGRARWAAPCCSPGRDGIPSSRPPPSSTG